MRTISLFILLAGPLNLAFSQKLDPPERILGPVGESVDKLRRIRGATDDEQREFTRLWKEMTRDVKVLNKIAVGKNKGDNVPEEYREQLKQYQKVLDRISESDQPIKEKRELCEALAADLNAKAKYAEKNPDAAFGLVKVTVRTLDGTKEKSGSEVMFVVRAWAEDKTRHKRYDMISSPTSRKLFPGAYLMWTKVPDQDQEGPRKPISVGEEGNSEQKIDLPVPPTK